MRRTSVVWLMFLLLAVLGQSCDRGEVPDLVTIDSDYGQIGLELFPHAAPIAVNNFMQLAREGYYDGTLVHRVVPGFLIQGGDSTGTGLGGRSAAGEPFCCEFGDSLRFDRAGRLGMARAQDMCSNDSQYFITLGPATFLDFKYTIFGQVVTGMDVVTRISELPRDERDYPLTPVIVRHVRVVRSQPGI